MLKKNKAQDEHKDETWLIPYSDMLTLLLALFIVMFAMSQIDQYKMQQMKMVLEAMFSGGTSMLEGDSSVSADELQIIQDPQPEQQDQPIPLPEMNTEALVEDRKLHAYKEKLEQYFEDVGMASRVTCRVEEIGLRVSIQDIALFDSSKADLRPEALPVIENLSYILEGLDNNIQIAGHTDNRPINTKEFPSNWELSVARGLNVLKALLKNPNLAPEKFSVVGYGEYQPVAPNTTEEGMAKNRRVELIIIRDGLTTTVPDLGLNKGDWLSSK